MNETMPQSEYSELVWRATILEEMTGREYLSQIVGKYAVQLELW